MTVTAKKKTYLQDMTPVEVAEARDRGAVVLLPIGSTECNGPHLPVGIDAVVATEVAKAAAERSEAIWLPPLSYGVSDSLMGLSGTLFLPPEMLSEQVEVILSALVANGFDRIVLVANHSPNYYPLQAACRRFRRRTGVLVALVYPAREAGKIYVSLFGNNPARQRHGGEPMTSLMMHLRPEAVRMDLANHQPTAPVFQGLPYVVGDMMNFGSDSVSFPVDMVELAEDGALSYPAEASAERGEQVFAGVVDWLVDFIDVFSKIDTTTSRKTVLDSNEFLWRSISIY